MMKLLKIEQETILLYNEAESTADVYTHDAKLLKKLVSLAKKYPEQIVKKDTQSYTVPKGCVLVREPYSEKRRAAARERALSSGAMPPRRDWDLQHK